MAIVTQTYYLSMVPGYGAPVCVRTSLGDTQRTIRFILFDQNGLMTIPSGYSARVMGTDPSGKAFDYPCSLGTSDVSFTPGTSITKAGSYIVRLRLSYANTQIIFSDTFEMYVSSTSK